MMGFSAGRRRLRVGFAAVAVGFAVGLSGCTSAKTDAKAAPAGSSAAPVPMVIGHEQAEAVFNRYLSERTASLDRRDVAGLAVLETGELLKESLALIQVAKLRGVDVPEFSFGRPEFFVPAERDQQGYPRSFVVLTREPSDHVNATRDAAVHYFVQEAAGGEWKAAARSWVNDKPVTPGKNDARMYKIFGFTARSKEIAAVGRDASGAVVLSPAAAADREVCGRYAEYMSFTAPDGEPESQHFLPGELTGDVVKAFNVLKEDLALVRKRYAFEKAGPELPVVRLADGKSLVTCTFLRTDYWTGKNATFRYGNGELGGVDALLGGEYGWWRDTTARRSATVTFEVAPAVPADVVGSNALQAPLLSAEGTPK
ncbi:hypothetical protein [Streptomyces sp. H27-S2]|uniref:hypothetical protein n=1 Tax=Streptomyces antarcticus TaxID=2996458 RepID=UPI00226D5E39|nr:hypothetical protein [Streptomyces sp. H27-S2]MCY0955251.1 hypothetical protein [Streptomyces sp. H27-S2]